MDSHMFLTAQQRVASTLNTTTSHNGHHDHRDQYSDVTRYILAAWTLAAILASLTGNITILIASLKHHAIKLDKISVCIIENLAMADLGYTVIGLVPTLCNTLLPHSSPFKTGLLCKVFGYAQYVFAIADIFLICALNVSKLTFIRFPLRARLRSKCMGRWVAAFIWALSTFYPVENKLLLPDVLAYNPITYRCGLPISDYELKSGYWRWLIPLNVALITVVPMVVVMVATVWLLAYVHRVRGLQRQGIITTLLLSIVYFVSYLPFSIICLIFYLQSSTTAAQFPGLLQFAYFIVFLNCSCNPLLYFISVSSFRDFVKGRVRRWVRGAVCGVLRGRAHSVEYGSTKRQSRMREGVGSWNKKKQCLVTNEQLLEKDNVHESL